MKTLPEKPFPEKSLPETTTPTEQTLASVRILVADDDAVARRLLRHHLESAGAQVIEAADGRMAQKLLDDELDVVLLDLGMPQADGLECLTVLRQNFPDLPAIMISGRGEIRDVVAAMKQGAFHYITKPIVADELLPLVQQAARSARLARDNRALRQAVATAAPLSPLVAESVSSRKLMHRVEQVAKLDGTVLITGPSGTGKTTLARRIHQGSNRAAGPFVAVSCANLPRDLIEDELFGHERGAYTGAVAARAGRVEVADHGTLFLDEIGDLPLELQPKLLTFLQERQFMRIGGNKLRQVDVRVIAATHRDLGIMIQEKIFREDLFYRLNVLTLHVAPLEERQEDILPLSEQILVRIARSRGCPKFRLSESARHGLLQHRWRGNIRELENVLERASAFCSDGTLTLEDLALPSFEPRAFGSSGSFGSGPPASLAGQTLDEIERRAIAETLRLCNGNRAEAARMLGVSERTIYNKIKKLDLENDA